jgi:hypothetical protein
MTIQKKNGSWVRGLFTLVSILALAWCLAFFIFDVRLDYEARKLFCGDDQACRARLWLEYRIK